MDKTYTADQLIKKFRGKYIKTMRTFDYTNKTWLYRVYGISRVIKENYNLPEDCLVK